jgi:hypothetical protein
MTADGPAPGRRHGLRTWTALGDLGRRPTEYEILTHGLNATRRAVPLELGPEAHGNRWLREHRDGIALQLPDPDAFRDPDALTYGSYVAMQDDQETYVEGLLERFDREDYDARLPGPALDLLAVALAPARYLAHGQQMLSAYVQQLAPGSYIANCATFQTADQLRRVQLLAYRTTQLQRTHPERGIGTAERGIWEQHPGWQPVREAVERALVEYDWDRALVATQLVVKPVADLLFLRELSSELAAAGAAMDALITESLWRDSERSRRWSAALASFLVGADPGNRDVLQGCLSEWADLGHAMAAAGSELIARRGGRAAAAIYDAVLTSWQELTGAAGLVPGPA